jgi:DNA-binding SARP family transcriptional activator
MPFRLRTLGGLSLVDGSPQEPRVGQRRKSLALLAMLAGAGELGVSREKVASHLWPEGDEEKTRGVLKQTVYSLRRELGEPDPVIGVVELRLNPAAFAVDLWEFERAVAAGNPADAVALYNGPFLDGFHVNDAPDFERWAENQRDRLAHRFAAQIEILALSAMGRNEPRLALDWWLRLTEQDPYDVRAVSGLLHACLAAGDRPKAIKYAERHMTMLRKELEITPDPEIRRLVEQARARPASSP